MPATATSSPRTRRGNRGVVIAAWIVGGLLALVVFSYLVLHFMAGQTVPRDASVNQVPIGGLSVEDAVAKLEAELGPADTAAFALTGQPGQGAELVPADIGLSVDYVASVRRAGGGSSWDPRDLVKVITGAGETPSVVLIDRAAVRQAVDGLSADCTRDPVSAALSLDGITVNHQPMQVGTVPQVDATVDAIIDAYRDAAHRVVTEPRDPFEVAAVLDLTEPEYTDQVIDPVAERLKAALQPVTITTPAASAELSAERIAEVTTLTVADGAADVTIDLARLYEIATEVIDPLTIVKPVNATVVMQGGQPTVVPAVDGQSITQEAFVAGVESAFAQPAPREVALEVESVPAKFTTEQAEALGIKEVVGEFTTYFPASSYHNTNLGLAAAGINNTLVKPGEVFSLAEATGPRNASTGYVAGGVLVGDHIEMIVGGGVSQSATTTYNAAFFAGMTDVEHQPHTQYFSQYPPGREATVFEGVLDLKFRNDTPHGVLMEAFIVPSIPGRGSITVRVWSTKYYDSVTASDPVMYNYRSGGEQVSTSDSCIAQSPSQGFDVTYQRILVLNGETTVQDYFWRYSPVDKITCKKPEPEPSAEPDPSASAEASQPPA